MNALIEETGAVLMGRGSFEMADPDSFVGNYEFQVPIFVLTHHPSAVPPKQDEHLTFTFVSEGVDEAIEQAKAAAGNKAVQVVGGAGLLQQLLRANLVDELRVDVMPVALGDGIRLLDNLDPERVQLEDRRAASGAAHQPSVPRRKAALGRVGEPTIGSQNRLSQVIDLVELCDGRIEDELVDSDVLELRCDVLYRIG
jgi:dihydrofolate reductase